ncbi:MAG: sensor histidine kinase, partial [Bacteroidia bacterium]
WKIIQQHFSLPDAKAEEGQTIGLEKITKENLELREAIKRRTIELEEKNRELEIETALEKVRAVAMSMHKPDDMLGICKALYHELMSLGFTELRNALIHLFVDEEKYFIDYDYSEATGGYISRIPYTGNPVIEKFIKIIRKSCDSFFEHALKKKELQDWIAFRKENNEADDPRLENIQSLHYYNYSVGSSGIGISTYKSITKEQLELLERFKNVFQLAYQRYSDISLAEAQAREAKIEAALERVRSRSLGMQKSDELNDVVSILFEKLKELQIPATAVGIAIYIDGSKDLNAFVCGENEAGLVITNYRLPYFNNQIPKDLINALEKQLDFFVGNYSKEEKNSFYKYVFEHTAEFRHLPEDIKRMIFESPLYTISMVAVKNAVFNINDFEGKVLSDNEVDIITRFARVFDQAYTRFLDLQKAEAQAREAQVELALERVRARTMAMQQSDELQDAANLLFLQVQALDIPVWSCGYNIWEKEEKQCTGWMSSEGFIQPPFKIPLTENPTFKRFYEARKKGESFYAEEVGGAALAAHYQYMLTLPDFAPIAEKHVKAGFPLPSFQINHVANFAHGNLIFITSKPVPEAWEVFKRFAKVFEQTYTRFLDLQKAEAQAREAQIEASLERIRAKAMSMHSSEDLLSVTQVLREQMMILDEKKLESIIIHVYNNVTDDFEAWYSFRNPEDPNGKIVDGKVVLDWSGTARARKDKEMYLSGENEYTISADRSMLAEWYNYLKIVVPEVVDEDARGNIVLPDVLYYNYSKFTGGALLLITNSEASDHSRNLLRRASKVFNLAYTRFLDLQKAEAQAKIAIKQASLDRVRGEIASMRSAQDLQRITPLVFNELTILGVPFIRCGVFIIDDSKGMVEVYLSAPDGHSLGVLRLPVHANVITQNVVEQWRKNKVYHQHWNKEDLINWTKSIMELGQIQDNETYHGSAAPSEKLDLHFVPFTQGMLYVGNVQPLNAEEIELVKSLAETFAVAYARYDDFIKLEKAKENIEATLVDLKAAQSQLIQSEKMASLGELTAGIAHEIQNPLNFVNNFSEVNTELIEDAGLEMDKGNIDEAKTILNDIKENEQKINHHGKRADAIVKGMLQHSRSSSGVKELTDINALADEYLRLAYHGLRAKDPRDAAHKSFNATMKTDFDESIGNINIIPQDIGRVILNLIINAFYAVDEKKKQSPHPLPNLSGQVPGGNEPYEPIVTIATKRLGSPSGDGGKVEIKISDNGGGIPQKVLDKIFQPFFTTKPTGQGTGLGLSLAFDIVTKGHGGELKVETKEQVGTTFIISLPV